MATKKKIAAKKPVKKASKKNKKPEKKETITTMVFQVTSKGSVKCNINGNRTDLICGLAAYMNLRSEVKSIFKTALEFAKEKAFFKRKNGNL